jgi:glycosyltransferase involved in cell wall biosynthesis
VRVAGFAPFLADAGVALDYRPGLTEGEYAFVASDASAPRKAVTLIRSAWRSVRQSPDEYDVRLVYRLRSLVPLPGVESWRAAEVYDFDDALFLGSISTANTGFGWIKREAKRSVAYMRAARLVIAGNSYLADRAAEYAKRVEVIPSCVDTERQPLREHERRDPITVGWIGSPSTSGYLQAVLPVFERINRDRLRARLLVIGADPGHRAPWLEWRAWSLSAERADLASFDVGIMPLRDSEWERGKCGYKLLQYFSAGVPAVASPVGVNRTLVAEDRGILASSPGEWERALELLIEDVGLRRSCGAAARAYVEREFSYPRWAPALAELLRSV